MPRRLQAALFVFSPVSWTARRRSPSLAVLRFGADALWRTTTDVFGVRSPLSWGIGVLGATRSSSRKVADGRFVSWLGQAQWAHLLPKFMGSTQIVTRLDVQLADQPLLSIEQIAVGGSTSVRGYRENQIVRDNALVASLEARIPIWREPFGQPQLELVPFVDVGHAWNEYTPRRSDTPASVGLGLRASPWRWASAAFFWGTRLTDLEQAGQGLQRHGIHFEVEVRYP